GNVIIGFFEDFLTFFKGMVSVLFCVFCLPGSVKGTTFTFLFSSCFLTEGINLSLFLATCLTFTVNFFSFKPGLAFVGVCLPLTEATLLLDCLLLFGEGCFLTDFFFAAFLAISIFQ
ncbi:MAG TPA: hypothetical protein PLU73_01025, partial [Bacteroidia bacterium]|nr:hypothetical protein [Bacteroidia bacterium]